MTDPVLAAILREPPPRDIRKDVARRALTANGMSASPFLGFLVVALGLGLVVMMYEVFPWGLPVQLLMQMGWSRPAVAEVTRLEHTRIYEGGDSKRRRRGLPVYRVHFRLRTEDGLRVDGVNYYTGTRRLPPGSGLLALATSGGEVRDPIEIPAEYFPLAPSCALLPGGRLSTLSAFSVLFGLFPLAFCVLVALHLIKKRRILALLRDGLTARAEVVDCRSTKAKANKRRRYRVTLLHDGGEGENEATVYAYGEEAGYYQSCLRTRETVPVVYLPDRPWVVMRIWEKRVSKRGG